MKVSGTPPTNTVTMNTTMKGNKLVQAFQWWKANSADDRGSQLIATVAYLKTSQEYRQRQANIYARLYGNQSLFSFIGANTSKMDQAHGLPMDRPTFNLVQSCVDTLLSKLTQSRPAPIFLTDNSDYRQRSKAKKANNFIAGEFYRTQVYDKVKTMTKDALIEGTGCVKIFETEDHKVGLDRVLLTELFTDANESMYGDPRSLYQIKLVDRDVVKSWFGKDKVVKEAAQAYPDNSADSAKSVSDLIMVIEGWRLPTTSTSKDGRHIISCSAGTLVDEVFDKQKFPFVFFHYSKRLLGFWAQGLAEQLMGTQMEINSLLFTISRAIKLVGVPRVFQEMGSKVVKSHHNNDIGTIVTYSGTKPSYEVAPCVPQEMYAQLQRLITYGYQQAGVSALQASSEKPAGLDSGEAIRTYDNISTDRFASLSKDYDNIFIDLAYQILDKASDIAKEQKSYTTVYPAKNSVKEIDLPEMDMEKDPYIIQCFNMSSLPKDPAGRMAKITEMIQAGMISIKEGRRLLDYPDLDQVEKLANASEERIYQYLDEIVEDGKYTGPDSFMDLALAKDTVVQYYNLYVSAKLEEDRCQMLRDFYDQTLDYMQAMQPPAPPMGPPGGAPNTPQAAPAPLPQSPLVPNAVQGAA